MHTAGFKTQDNRWVARRVRMARSFRQRLLGLLRNRTLSADEGLLLSPGASIHTFGMRFPIDALFLNGQMKILRLAAHIPPWRVRLAPSRTRHVLELPAGSIHALGLKSNTYICIELPSFQLPAPLPEVRGAGAPMQASSACSCGQNGALAEHGEDGDSVYSRASVEAETRAC